MHTGHRLSTYSLLGRKGKHVGQSHLHLGFVRTPSFTSIHTICVSIIILGAILIGCVKPSGPELGRDIVPDPVGPATEIGVGRVENLNCGAGVAFGKSAIGRAVTQEIKFKNSGTGISNLTPTTFPTGGAYQYTGGTFPGKAADGCGRQLSPGAACSISIDFQPTSIGPTTSGLSIFFTTGDSDPEVINKELLCPLLGEGVRPGTLVSGFRIGPGFSSQISSGPIGILVQKNGGVIVAAREATVISSAVTSYAYLSRTAPSGSPDSTFLGSERFSRVQYVASNNSSDPYDEYDFTLLEDKSSGALYLGERFRKPVINGQLPAHAISIWKFKDNGRIDLSFGVSGNIQIGTYTYSRVRKQEFPDKALGAFLVENLTGSEFTISRVNANGVVDQTFGTNGQIKVSSQYQYDLRISKNGRVSLIYRMASDPLCLGAGNSIRVMVFTRDGKPDITFGNQGVTSSCHAGGSTRPAHVLLDNNKVIIAENIRLLSSSTNSTTSIYEVNGGANSVFKSTIDLIANDSSSSSELVSDIILESNNNLLVSGVGFLTRLLANGSVDASFGIIRGYDSIGLPLYEYTSSVVTEAGGVELIPYSNGSIINYSNNSVLRRNLGSQRIYY